MPKLNPAQRLAVYRLCVAIGAALVAFGVLTGEQAASIGGVVLAATNLLAAANVTS